MNCKDIIKVFISGFLGGSADVVPGISGGTVYYLLGIYNQLLSSISTLPHLLSKIIRERSLRCLFTSKELGFLVVLLLGVSCAFFFLTTYIVSLLNSEGHRSLLFALFFGLVLGSFFIIAKPLFHVLFEHISTKNKLIIYSLFVFGCIIGFSIDTLSSSVINISNTPTYSVRLQFPYEKGQNILNKNGDNYNAYLKEMRGITADQLRVLVTKGYVDHQQTCMRQADGKIEPVDIVLKTHTTSFITDFFYPVYFICGAIACIAMLLPGISGSYMLNVIGMYGPILSHLLTVIDAIKNLHSITFCFHSLMILLQVILGIMFGGILFSVGIKSVIEKFPRQTHALLSGCLLGSIGVLWPFQNMLRVVNPFTIERGYELQTKGFYCPSFSAFLSSEEWFIMLGAFSFLFLLEGIKHMRVRSELSFTYMSSQGADTQ